MAILGSCVRRTSFFRRRYNRAAIELKVLMRPVPTNCIAAIAATAINAAINAYSIAVTPRRSSVSPRMVRKFNSIFEQAGPTRPLRIITSGINFGINLMSRNLAARDWRTVNSRRDTADNRR